MPTAVDFMPRAPLRVPQPPPRVTHSRATKRLHGLGLDTGDAPVEGKTYTYAPVDPADPKSDWRVNWKPATPPAVRDARQLSLMQGAAAGAAAGLLLGYLLFKGKK